MMSSEMPSEKYSCSGSPLILANGSTAIAVRSSAGQLTVLRFVGRARAAVAARRLRPQPSLCTLDVADEAKAFARDGADHGLILAAVADRLSRGVDAAGQGGFGDDAAVPDGLDQIVLGDDPFAVLDQIDQEVEHLRFDGDAFAGAGQLAQVDIKHMVGKAKLHVFHPESQC